MIASSGQNSRRVSGGYISSLDGYDGQWEYMIDKIDSGHRFQSRLRRGHSRQFSRRTDRRRFVELE
jgi:hypothetical protein